MTGVQIRSLLLTWVKQAIAVIMVAVFTMFVVMVAVAIPILLLFSLGFLIAIQGLIVLVQLNDLCAWISVLQV